MKTPSQRVRASEARKVEAGGMRLPGGVLPPDAAAALRYLCGALGDPAEYPTASAAIARALIREAKRVRVKRIRSQY